MGADGMPAFCSGYLGETALGDNGLRNPSHKR
jgi:hypothetical protein